MFDDTVKPGVGPSVSSVSSECEGEGYSNTPGDCSVYYKCQHHARFLYICPTGMLYDNALGLCNWPYLVRCPMSQSQGTFMIVCV